MQTLDNNSPAEDTLPPAGRAAGPGRVLVAKWDALYGRLLADTVVAYFPEARVRLAQSAGHVRRRLEEETQDLVIAGLSFGDEDGLPLLPWLATSVRVGAVLLVTLRQDAQTLAALRELRRVSVFDPATDDPARFPLALAHASQGRRYVSPAHRDRMAGLEDVPDVLTTRLTATEQMVLAVIGDGSDDKAGSTVLGLEPASVQAHRKRIMRKLGVQTRESLFRRSLELGVVRVLPDGRTQRLALELWRSRIEERKRQREHSP
jgi:DNA-binding NarL/FixJ family response regulator